MSSKERFDQIANERLSDTTHDYEQCETCVNVIDTGTKYPYKNWDFQEDTCKAYPDDKPFEVCFCQAPCPHYKKRQ